MTETSIALTAREQYDVMNRLNTIIEQDESTATGHVRLRAKNGRRRWYGMDRNVVVAMEYAHDGPDLDVLLSPRLFTQNLDAASQVELRVPAMRADGTFAGSSAMVVDGLRIVQPVRNAVGFPDVDHWIASIEHGDAAVARLSSGDLHRVISAVNKSPAGYDDRPMPSAHLVVGAGQMTLVADWPGWGESRASLSVETAGKAEVALWPAQIARAVTGMHDWYEVLVPIDRDQPVLVRRDGEYYALVRTLPWQDAAEALGRVQQLLDGELGFGWIEPDDDGDLPVPFEDAMVFVRTVDGRTAGVQAFTVLTDHVEQDRALLQRCNDLNADLRGCRVFHVDGQVLLEADLPADALDATSLRAVLNTVADATRMVRSLFDVEV